MVSLENRMTYLSRINESPKLAAFNDLLLNRTIVQPLRNEISESDEIYFGIITAIQSNEKMAFEKQYNKKNKSKPGKESPPPFVNDDFLIFSIIMGISKFNIDNSWIKSIVEIRSRNPITITLDNLIEENYTSTSNLPEIVLMFLKIINQKLVTNTLLNFTFQKINENTALFESKSDFQILCAIHAYDSIVQLKEAPEGSEIQQLKSFSSSFVKRTKFLSWILQLSLFILFFYCLLKMPLYSPEIIEAINKYGYIFTIAGALGFTLVGNQLDFISQKSHKLTMKLFGYPEELIIKSENK